MTEYPLAPDGVFLTMQGEGPMLGVPMVFIRLAGCDVNCEHCDTNYNVGRRVSLPSILQEVATLGTCTDWVFITGGEPTIHELQPLVNGLRRAFFRVAMVTSGQRPVKCGSVIGGVDFLMVSPHRPDKWVQYAGDSLNLVPGLNGFGLQDFANQALACQERFTHCYVTPCDGKPETVAECLDWVKNHRGWRLGVQAHKCWQVP